MNHADSPAVRFIDVRARTIGRALVAILVAGAVAGPPGGEGSGGRPTGVHRPCRDVGTLPSGPPGLPHPVILSTGCGRFEVFRDGRVDFLGRKWWSPRRYHLQGGGTLRIRDGRLEVIRGRSVWWRSARSSYSLDHLGSVAANSTSIAFAVYRQDIPRMFIASEAGPERPLTRHEEPVAWLSSGDLLTGYWKDGWAEWRSRAPGGRLLGRVATNISSYAVDEADGSVIYLTKGGTVRRLDGRTSSTLATVRSLGFRTWAWAPSDAWIPSVLVLSDGRIALAGPSRLVVLEPDGRLFDQASFPMPVKPPNGWGNVGTMGDRSITVDPHTGAVDVLVSHWGYAEVDGRWPGWEGIYSLGGTPGPARLLWGHRMRIAACAHYSTLAWHGTWLLYGACEGRTIAIDTTGRTEAVDITGLARRLPTTPDRSKYPLESVRWAKA